MTSKRINRAIKHTGLKITYTRGDGYFYFTDIDDFTVGDSVYVCYMNQFSLGQWVEQAEEAAIKGRN